MPNAEHFVFLGRLLEVFSMANTPLDFMIQFQDGWILIHAYRMGEQQEG